MSRRPENFFRNDSIVKSPEKELAIITAAREKRASPDLLDMIYICQQRQEWYRDYARSVSEEPLHFVGSAQLTDDIAAAAARISEALDFDLEERRQTPTWTDALRRFIEQADSIGVLVMCSGVVLNNNYRHLDPSEFRGFAISDDYAPLVFINGADTKAAQMFTLAHCFSCGGRRYIAPVAPVPWEIRVRPVPNKPRNATPSP